MTKKTVLIILCTILLMCLVGCGKSESAKLVDNKINSIGTVTLDSESLIIDAENEYAKLADKEKEEVEYYQTLVDARARYDELLKEENNKKEEIKKEIQVLIDDNKIKDVKIDKNNFPHLIGLHKLLDIPVIRQFNDIYDYNVGKYNGVYCKINLTRRIHI